MQNVTPSQIEICILAAGMGTRMKSDKPKVLHPIGGKPMLAHLLDTAAELNPKRVHVVIGSGADQVRSTFCDHDVNWVMQSEQKGTGHAVMQALPDIDPSSRVLILPGDGPLLELQTIRKLLDEVCDLGVLTVDQPHPFNYGRIIKDGDQLIQIVEERDANERQKEISEINASVMIASASSLDRWLSRITTGNAQQEYLLTDIVAMANNDKAIVRAIKTVNPNEVQGVNTFEQLAALESYYQRNIARGLMEDGVHLVDPQRINLRGSLSTGRDVSIDVNCIFEGDVVLGNNVMIGANCTISSTRIGNNAVIKPNTMIDGAVIADDCSVGPFARIRPGTTLAEQVAVGNFVEIKKSSLGKGTKSSHLTYLGDAIIGSEVNIGAGTITCNYDGVLKHITEIGDQVFVGSNSSLVAPVTIGEGSTIAAGSTITREVSGKSLAIARGRQKNLTNWKGPRDK
ncbi:MAG: bifunctional UDP-N-acetylglucosamine diphosphorylase/glucosamine-1-phosphate N-acetyltransferase GlmU [bacterium]|nr:UDP-N-acetylglucosamine diphosphorylase/glucosamine-1-phosphate N-acetyltransferase [Gammaproteobacteria bacterium]HIL95162.1 UDP-N-acetylglucosamine diphosphorylase/glucosamine-1-phosphate N-acetyltransferase [Pseudomonadales bacterium]